MILGYCSKKASDGKDAAVLGLGEGCLFTQRRGLVRGERDHEQNGAGRVPVLLCLLFCVFTFAVSRLSAPSRELQGVSAKEGSRKHKVEWRLKTRQEDFQRKMPQLTQP